MKKEILISLIAVVLIAGCIDLGDGGGNRDADASMTDGLVINDFFVSENRILDDESVIFSLEVENKGGTTATSVEAILAGIPGWEDADPKNADSLSPPDLTIQPPMPGEFKIFEWELAAPSELGQGVEHSYDVTGRVTYDYKTTAAITIPGYSKTEYRRMTEEGKGEPNTVQVSNTVGTEGSGGAPVKVDITPKNVIIFKKDEGEDKTMSYRLVFRNVGSGVPIGENEDGEQEDGIIDGTVKLSGPAEFGDCLGSEGGTDVEIQPGDVKLRRKGTAEKLCEIRILDDQWGEADLNTVSLSFDLDYQYFIDKTATVTVVGQSD